MLKKERKMKQHRRFRTIRATVVLMVIAGVAILIAPQALASAPSATATLTGGVTTAGVDGNFTFSVTPSSRTLASFTVTAPAGWLIDSTSAGTISSNGRTISVSGLSVNSSGSASVNFAATACVAQTYGWGYTATDSQGRAYATASAISATVAAPSCSLAFVNQHQPKDAKQGELITGDPFEGGANKVEVQLLDGNSAPLTDYPVTVTLGLFFGLDGNNQPLVDENGQKLINGTLSVTPEDTDANGIATFDTQLSIAEKNEPAFTSYSLQPQTTGTPTISGTPSNGFNIWETQCPGGCSVSLRGSNLDLYTSPSGSLGDLSASQLPFGAATDIECAGQTVIFADSVFTHEFTGTLTGAVFLKSHVTRADMKASANNGQAHVQWCIGLPGPWAAAGGQAVPEDINGPNNPLGTLYVGIAPACPNANPAGSAPCISRQYGDGHGGSYTEGYLPGDPPRRT
jgi:hypothetical protein